MMVFGLFTALSFPMWTFIFAFRLIESTVDRMSPDS